MAKERKNSSFVLTEEKLNDIILSVLKENRKVLKLGNSQPAPSMPQQMPPMPQQGGDMGTPMDNMQQVDDTMGGQMEDPMAGEMGGGPEQNQFDTNFDAGVEADEETDPKHYIQQLTGKLSQSLNSYNEENGPDAGLSKYVASMIIAAACKNIDEKAKKELIEKINTASSDEAEDVPDEGTEEPMEQPNDMEQQPEQPMMESIITKKQLHELAFGTTKERKTTTPKTEPKKKSIFSGKSF